MIDDLDRTIKKLLEEELPRVRDGQVDVAFAQPNRDWKRDKAALNFFLYDVRQNAVLRQHQWQEILTSDQRPMRTNHQVPLQRTPLRLDCFYMVTAWSNDPLDEHRLLIECLATLARYPVLNRYEQMGATGTGTAEPAPVHGPMNGAGNGVRGNYLQRPPVRDYLVGSLANLTYEIPTRLAEHDVLTNPAEVWGSLENSMKAAFSYVVTLPISPWLPIATREVETAAFLLGPAEQKIEIDPTTGKPKGPPTLQRIAHAEQLLVHKTEQWPVPNVDQLVAIGGLVRDALRNDEPVAGIEVHVKDSGLYTRTDEQGRFRFPRLWFGESGITLVVDPNGPFYIEKPVRVPPGKQEHYDITIHIVRNESNPRATGNRR
ncbi:MAG: Pvc16 family protein [Caldilineaceae bacterium]